MVVVTSGTERSRSERLRRPHRDEPDAPRSGRRGKSSAISVSLSATSMAVEATSSGAEAWAASFRFVPGTRAAAAAPRSQLPLVTPGEPIPTEPGCLRGHGTLLRADGALVATVAGVVERVNKLVSVRPLRSRYVGEVGDVVLCRVLEVGQKRWKVDVQARQHGVLMLSSINLPGGEQRRRTAEDQLNMRQFYVEGDVLSAEARRPSSRRRAPPPCARGP